TVRTNEKPKLIGVVDETITIGDEFYPLEGVQAIDKEDGDITEFIEITGKVNNAKADTYELTYSITDSDDNTVTASRNITVQENFNESEKLRLNVLNSARKLIGKPYVFGGNYPPLGGDIGTDCSGLCQWSYHENGIEITRTTYTQINEGFEVEVTDLKPGDL
ncbi:immunoglobulin-like domain-containing protein, partial [Escherichia coli]